MEIIFNHYPNKTQYSLNVNLLLEQRYIFHLVLQSMKVSFQLLTSSSTILTL